MTSSYHCNNNSSSSGVRRWGVGWGLGCVEGRWPRHSGVVGVTSITNLAIYWIICIHDWNIRNFAHPLSRPSFLQLHGITDCSTCSGNDLIKREVCRPMAFEYESYRRRNSNIIVRCNFIPKLLFTKNELNLSQKKATTREARTKVLE